MKISKVSVEPVSPDERAFDHYIASPSFQEGLSRGHWRIAGETEWPFVIVAITAGSRKCGPVEFFLRFDLTDYPASVPTALPWNPATGGKLEEEFRPQGVRVAPIFRTDWNNGDALYAPFDRQAVARHPDWPQRYPHYAWNTRQGLTPVLNYLHKLLNDEDYTGTQAN